MKLKLGENPKGNIGNGKQQITTEKVMKRPYTLGKVNRRCSQNTILDNIARISNF